MIYVSIKYLKVTFCCPLVVSVCQCLCVQYNAMEAKDGRLLRFDLTHSQTKGVSSTYCI